jgi:hypothetical protein
VHEESHGLLDPWPLRHRRLTWGRRQSVVDHRPHAAEIRLTDELFTPAVWPHVAIDLSEWHRNEPLRTDETLAPLWLAVQIAAQRVLGASRLVRWVDPS